MDFLNEIGRKFSHMARSVTEKTREGVENTRIFTDLRSAKNDLEELYCEFGRVCYEIRQGAGDPPEADALAERIGECLERIRELTAMREEIRTAGMDLLQAAPVRIHPDFLVKKGKGVVRRCPRCGEWYPAVLGALCRPCQGDGPYLAGKE